MRSEGVKAGLFRPVTLWPFPSDALNGLVKKSKAKAVIVPEMNQGQMVLEIERTVAGSIPVYGLNRFDGEAITPDEISAMVKEVLK